MRMTWTRSYEPFLFVARGPGSWGSILLSAREPKSLEIGKWIRISCSESIDWILRLSKRHFLDGVSLAVFVVWRVSLWRLMDVTRRGRAWKKWFNFWNLTCPAIGRFQTWCNLDHVISSLIAEFTGLYLKRKCRVRQGEHHQPFFDADIQTATGQVSVPCLWTMHSIQLVGTDRTILPHLLPKSPSKTRLSLISSNPIHPWFCSRCAPRNLCTQCWDGTHTRSDIQSICTGNEDAILERCGRKLLSGETESRTRVNPARSRVAVGKCAIDQVFLSNNH